MRYIDRSNCKGTFDKGNNSEIKSMGKLTRAACRIAEQNKLGLMKTRQGYYTVVRESGLGAYENFFSNLAEVDDFLKHLDQHENTKY